MLSFVRVGPFLCVSVPEKTDLGELCSTFPPLLIHPSLSLLFARLDGMEREREREGGRKRKGQDKQNRFKAESRQTVNTRLFGSLALVFFFFLKDSTSKSRDKNVNASCTLRLNI